MAIEDFADLMPERLTIRPFSSRDRTGVAVYGTARANVPARWTPMATQVRTPSGVEATSTSVAWVADVAIGVEDQVILPDGSTPPILNVERPEDEDGPHHTKVFFG